VALANSAAQVSTVLKTGRMPCWCRKVRTTASFVPSRSASWRSEKPARLARAMPAGSRVRLSASSLSAAIWSTNQASMPVAAASSSTDAPARSASCTVRSRPSWGRLAFSTSSDASPGSPANDSTAAGCSSERSAFCSASPKLRPIPIDSPTDFIVVVSSWSAPGNFSKAKRGAFTTT